MASTSGYAPKKSLPKATESVFHRATWAFDIGTNATVVEVVGGSVVVEVAGGAVVDVVVDVVVAPVTMVSLAPHAVARPPRATTSTTTETRSRR
jgi:hypothetical protein